MVPRLKWGQEFACRRRCLRGRRPSGSRPNRCSAANGECVHFLPRASAATCVYSSPTSRTCCPLVTPAKSTNALAGAPPQESLIGLGIGVRRGVAPAPSSPHVYAKRVPVQVETQSCFWLRNNAEVGLRRLPAPRIHRLGLLVGDRTGNDDVIALLPVHGCCHHVLGGQL